MIVLATAAYQKPRNSTKTVKPVWLGRRASTWFMWRTLHFFEYSEHSLRRRESLDNLKSLWLVAALVHSR